MNRRVDGRLLQRWTFARWAAALWLGLTVTGCGSDGPERFAVSGKVTVNGKPFKELEKEVVSASISFIPQEGTPGGTSGAEINLETGEYEVQAEQGLRTGAYKVAINGFWKTGKMLPPDLAGPASVLLEKGATMESLQSPEQLQFIPPNFNTTTELKAEIENGSNSDTNFDLQVATSGSK